MTLPLFSVLFLMTISFSIKTSSGQDLPLDMASNSVDDSYDGCEKTMNELVVSKYIEYEKKNTAGFEANWNEALKNATLGLMPNPSAAIYMYTMSCSDCSYEQFNDATRNGYSAYESDDFQFYTLHFFLTAAIQELKKEQPGCVTTYRRTNVKFEKDVLKKKIRFGSFTSSSLKNDLILFGNESCFQIYTCFGAKIKNFSAFKDEEEVLIPPYEVFNITAVKIKDKNNDLQCNVVYELENAGNKSNLQCRKINSGSSALLSSMFVTVSLFTVLTVM